MTNDPASSADSLFGWPLRYMLPGGLASSTFAPNPGWTFGNVVINSTNSTAPAVEQAIVSQHSYGRQIGRLVDAVSALLDAVPDAQVRPGVPAFMELARDVRKIKQDAKATHLQRLTTELQELQRDDPVAWRKLFVGI